MKRNVNLLEGDIKKSLTALSLPLMAVSFVQMTYNLIDMFWLGRLSTDAVAAAGTVGLFLWIANAIVLISGVGLATHLSQAYGKGDYAECKKLVKSGIQLTIIMAIIYMAIILLFKKNMLSFYKLDQDVFKLADDYLTIMAFGFIFTFMVPVFGTYFKSMGNSQTPFRIAVISLITNIVLDPIMIFNFKLGIKGAAYASVMAQMLAFLIYAYEGKVNDELYNDRKIFISFNKDLIKKIFKTGYPACLVSAVHALISVIMTRFISSFGSMAIAVATLGTQIESISWMSAEGFSTAMTAFMGQNYGAKNFERLKEGYKEGLKIFILIGFSAFLLLFFAGELFYSKFLPGDTLAIAMGTTLLKIYSVSEVFMSIEIGTTGALNGLGLTKYPAISGAILNGIRIPLALILMPIYQETGLWITISISMALKGIILFIIYKILENRTNGFRQIEKVY
ncbi:MAG: MATE family efflux transporter [Tissierellia bacterium]|nr:MATE family efflux transporter [Tissierellia bacterium]